MLIHTGYGNLPLEYVEMLRISGRWAVPFFFVCSGYFLEKKIQNFGVFPLKALEKNMIYLISILLVANFIYLPISIIRQHSLNELSVLLSGAFVHLWFIGSLLFGYIFIWYVYSIKMDRFLAVVSGLILLGTLVADSYDNFLGVSINYDLFRFLQSVPFLWIGMFIAKKRLSKNIVPVLVLLSSVGFGLQYYEVNLLFDLFGYSKFHPQLLVGTILLVVSLFMLVTLLPIKESRPVIWGRKYSLFIYLYHPLVYVIMGFITGALVPSYYLGYLRTFNPVLGFIITLTTALVVDKYFPALFAILSGKLTNAKRVAA